jgi:hypothetical protein
VNQRGLARGDALKAVGLEALLSKEAKPSRHTSSWEIPRGLRVDTRPLLLTEPLLVRRQRIVDVFAAS